jgi:hypothetical protein
MKTLAATLLFLLSLSSAEALAQGTPGAPAPLATQLRGDDDKDDDKDDDEEDEEELRVAGR